MAGARHLVARRSDAAFSVPERFAELSKGFTRWTIVDESSSVHQDFGVCELEPGGVIDTHVHSFEESFYVLSGEAVCHTTEGAFRLREGDYGVVPVGSVHAWKTRSGDAANRPRYVIPNTIVCFCVEH